MAATKGTKEIKTDWPHEEGLEARTTSQTGRSMTLVPTVSKVTRRDSFGTK